MVSSGWLLATGYWLLAAGFFFGRDFINMKTFILLGRGFYAIALIVYGIQQFYFGTFRDVFFSVYQKHLPFLKIFAYLFGAYLVITGVCIFIRDKGKRASFILGCVLLALLLGTHLSYELISEPNKLYHLGLWTTPLKELALAGGAFIVAGSFGNNDVNKRGFPEKLIPYGNLGFFYVLSSYGISHIIYAPYLVGNVPGWMANPEFWVTLTGVTLAAGGIAVILGIRIRVICLLLSLQIFLWVWLVHVPGTLALPLADNRGNLLASSFDALAFSGVALLAALTMRKQQWVEDVESWGRQDD